MIEHLKNPEEKEKFTAESMTVEYSDGNTALVFRNPGEVVAWGGHKWVDSPDRRSANTTIITTKSGNQYAIGEGIILNARERTGLNVPRGADIPSITLGESWEIPGVMKTSSVEHVAVEYKLGAESDYVVDTPSPFEAAKNELALKRQRFIEEYGLY